MVCITILSYWFIRCVTHGWKVEGDQLGLNTGRLRSAKGRAGCWVREGSPSPAVRVRGYHPRNICENSDAKSCILVTTCCEISCFLKTTTKKSGNQYIVDPNLKVGGPVSPGPYSCCACGSLILSVCQVASCRLQSVDNWYSLTHLPLCKGGL